jgi:phage terminase Nu1 subunit (DNA packaging protein)
MTTTMTNNLLEIIAELKGELFSSSYEKKILSQKELIEYLKCSSTTLYRYRCAGMPFSKKTGKLYYNLEQVIKFLHND